MCWHQPSFTNQIGLQEILHCVIATDSRRMSVSTCFCSSSQRLVELFPLQCWPALRWATCGASLTGHTLFFPAVACTLAGDPLHIALPCFISALRVQRCADVQQDTAVVRVGAQWQVFGSGWLKEKYIMKKIFKLRSLIGCCQLAEA